MHSEPSGQADTAISCDVGDSVIESDGMALEASGVDDPPPHSAFPMHIPGIPYPPVKPYWLAMDEIINRLPGLDREDESPDVSSEPTLARQQAGAVGSDCGESSS